MIEIVQVTKAADRLKQSAEEDAFDLLESI